MRQVLATRCAALLGCIVAALIATPALGAIVYIDAIPKGASSPASPAGNTTVDGNDVVFFSNPPPPGFNAFSGMDGMWEGVAYWGYREHVGTNGNRIWEADRGVNPSHTLITTIDLAPGGYALHVLFWANQPESGWDIGVRVGSSGSFTTYAASPATLTSETGSEFEGTVATRAPNGPQTLYMHRAELGRFVVNSPLTIYIIAPGVGDPRTWYDGIGYEVLLPEPAAMLAGLPMLLMLRRRR